jgi:hypothetical protein
MSRYFLQLLTFLMLFDLSGQSLATGFEKRVSDGVVQIFVLESAKPFRSSSGTGFVINSQGYVGTNNHVIKDAMLKDEGKLRVYVNPEGTTVNLVTALTKPNATVVWQSGSLDMAIVKIDDDVLFGIKGLILTSVLPERGENVTALGYPGAANNNEFNTNDKTSNATFTKGVLSRTYQGAWKGKNVPLSIVQHSAEISWGNSGGPLVDECGRVIGVNTQLSLKGKAFLPTKKGMVTLETPAAGVYYASQITELIKELDRRHINYTFSQDKCLSAGDIQDEFRTTLITVVAVVALGFMSLGILMVIFLRKPRQQVVHAIENVSRRFSRKASDPQPMTPAASSVSSATAPSLILDGRDGDTGRQYRIVISGHDMARGSVVIGRDPGVAQVVIDHPEVSRAHAMLFWQDGCYRITDNESTNGTRLNNQDIYRSQQLQLRNGDKLEFGTLDLRVIIA